MASPAGFDVVVTPSVDEVVGNAPAQLPWRVVLSHTAELSRCRGAAWTPVGCGTTPRPHVAGATILTAGMCHGLTMRPPDSPDALTFPLERCAAAGELIAEEGRGLVDLLILADSGPESRELHAEFGLCLARLALTLLGTASQLAI